MLFRAEVANCGEDVRGAQSLKVIDGDRSLIGTVLRRHPRVAQSLGAFDDVTGEAAVLQNIDAMGAVRCEEATQFSAGCAEGIAGIGVDHGGTGLAVAHGDLDQFVGAVGLEPKFAVESAGQSRIDAEEVIDLLLITRADEAEIEAVNLQGDEELVDCLHTDHVGPTVVMSLHEAIELIHEKNATQGTIDELIGLWCRRPNVFATEI